MYEGSHLSKPRGLAGYVSSNRATAIALLNLAVWLTAIFLDQFIPDSTAYLISGATVMSAGLGADILPDRLTASLLPAISGIASTALILTVYAHLTGLRLGMKVGGVGDSVDAIATFTAIYLSVLFLVYAVNLTSGFLRRGS
ncbi:hypothetical protein [Mesorhizobium sp. KR9-304]|uniref:hypothetical protein n=1 Tax=Mesorhizobium sp. KR9-304 TaxID=3156614 RepID=UPI0032B53BB1